MWDSFFRWMNRNGDSVSWFVIGWLCFATLQSIALGDYYWATFDAVLVYINYKLISVRS